MFESGNGGDNFPGIVFLGPGLWFLGCCPTSIMIRILILYTYVPFIKIIVETWTQLEEQTKTQDKPNSNNEPILGK